MGLVHSIGLGHLLHSRLSGWSLGRHLLFEGDGHVETLLEDVSEPVLDVHQQLVATGAGIVGRLLAHIGALLAVLARQDVRSSGEVQTTERGGTLIVSIPKDGPVLDPNSPAGGRRGRP